MSNKEVLAGDLTKRDVAYLVFKRKNQILAIFAASLVMATLAAYFSPRSYQASATVYVVRNLPPIATVGPSTLNFFLDRKEVLNSEVDLITSRAVAEQVADILLASQSNAPRRSPSTLAQWTAGVAGAVRGGFLAIGLADAPPTQRDALITSLLGAIEAKPAVNSDFITVTARSEDPEYAARVVNTFTKVYLDRRLALFKRPGLEEFYDSQIQRVRGTLDVLDRQINTLKTGSGVVTEDEQVRLKLQELSALNAELNKVRSEMQELGERTAALQARIQTQPDSVMASRVLQRNPTIADLEKKTTDLEAEKALQLNRFQGDSPVIQELDRSIQRLEAAAAQAPATVVSTESMVQNSIRTTLLTDLYQTETDYRAKIARERALAQQIEALAQQIQRVDTNATELRRLSAGAATASKMYASYVEQREAARIATSTDPNVTNVQVINPAGVPARPRYPRMLLIALGGAVGLLMGVMLAFVSELFSHTLNRREDVERELELPVLAAMPNARVLRYPR